MKLYQLMRPILFGLNPEFSHEITLHTLKMLHRIGAFRSPVKWPTSLSRKYFGLSFANPIGLAAGLDKNAECLPAWESFGFGFIEVGTVTPRPQLGNSKPRLFRLARDFALINRMGFNNKGVDHMIHQLTSFSVNCPVGVNIGKNKDTSLGAAAEDYLTCFAQVYPYADYVTVNLSSPNTPGLKSLQHGELLKSIIVPLKEKQHQLSDKLGKKVPILVKLSPDLEAEEMKQIVENLLDYKIEGIIAANTTVKRAASLRGKSTKQEGGLSGAPVFESSTQMVRLIYQQAGEDLPIIAVGGIMCAQDAKEKIAAGAKLVQLYTGLIYRGPQLVKEIANSLSNTCHLEC